MVGKVKVMANGYKEFHTVRELGIYVQEKFDNIEHTIKNLIQRPDLFGQWIIRILLTLMAIGQFIIAYKILLK